MPAPEPSPSAPRPRRGCLPRALLLAGGLLAALLAGEVALRLGIGTLPVVEKPYDPSPTSGESRQTNYRKVPDPALSFVLRQNARSEMVYPAFGDTPERTILYRTNSAGFRDREFEREPAPGTFRICVLGDSFTHGNGVQVEESFPKVLERALRAGPAGERVEVLNFGAGGYNTRQEVELLRTRVAAFEPDLVLLAYYVNDVLAPFGTPVRETEEERELGPWPAWLPAGPGSDDGAAEGPGPVARVLAALADVSHLARRVVTELQSRERTRRHFRRFDIYYREGAEGWRRVREAFADAARFCAERGIELHLTIYPNPAYPATNPFAAHEAKVVALATEHGIPFHDVSGALRGHTAEELVAHPHDRHGSALCNELIGRELARQLAPRVERALGL